MARALVRSVRTFVKPTNLEEEHGKESEESKEDRQGDQESRQEDQENEEVSARFSASRSRRGIAITTRGELDASQDVSGRKCGDDQAGPMCTRLKKPTRLMHMGPVFVSGRRRTRVSRFPGLRLGAPIPSLRGRGITGPSTAPTRQKASRYLRQNQLESKSPKCRGRSLNVSQPLDTPAIGPPCPARGAC